MVTQRVRIACPNCTHPLQVRPENIGRKGECKFCGHRFRPRVPFAPAVLADRAIGPVPGRAGPSLDVGLWVQTLERSLEKSGTRLTVDQATLVEQIMVMLGEAVARPLVANLRSDGMAPPPRRNHRLDHPAVSPARTHGVELPDENLAADVDENDRLEIRFDDPPPSPVGLAADSVRQEVRADPDGKFELAGAGTDAFQFVGETPVVARAPDIPPTDVVECVNRLVHERDGARRECARLEDEVVRLRNLLAERTFEVARLRKSADKLQVVRAERDRLNAERTMLTREAAQLQTRLVETQVALVEVEAELEECRDCLAAEREARQQEHQDLIGGAERPTVALRSKIEAEMRAAEQTHLAGGMSAFSKTVVDVEFQQGVSLPGD